MGNGQSDAEEPAGRRPLPPEDRVWRHPAEVALDARRGLARRRARRIRTGVTLIGGALAVSVLVWVNRPGPDAGGTDDPILLASASAEAIVATTTIATTTTAPADPDRVVRLAQPDDVDPIVVRSTGGDALAGALMIREGYVVTSGAALGDAEAVLVTWGESSEPGTVIGRDEITDVTVIRVSGSTPITTHRDARAREGDEIKLLTTDGTWSVQQVVAEQSTSAMADGEPVVGIVVLDGRIGNVAPGTPAHDREGNVVGMAAATADSAPTALVPIDLAREVAEEIIATGEATHPWLGITAADPDVADLGRDGSLVTAVTVDGPADVGAMMEGDLITDIDGRTVDSTASMVATLRSYEPGETVDIGVWRDGQEVRVTVDLASLVEATT